VSESDRFLSRWARRARGAIARGAFRTGALERRVRNRLRGNAVVLMYHRVVPRARLAECLSSPGIVVSAEAFETQVNWLANRLRCLDLAGFTRTVATGPAFPEPSCLITFDDGWRDNLVHALPVLERAGTPAAIFLAAGYVGTSGVFWQERLTAALGRLRAAIEAGAIAADAVRSLPGDLAHGAWVRAPRDRFSDAASDAVASFKSPTSAISANQAIERVERLVGGPPNPAERHFLDWDEVRAMTRRGIEFGAHGVTHTILTHPDVDLEAEIGGAKRILERELGRVVDAYCYPNGNHDENVRGEVRRGGFRIAFSTSPGYVLPGVDAFAVRRVNVHEDMACDLPMFLARVGGLW